MAAEFMTFFRKEFIMINSSTLRVLVLSTAVMLGLGIAANRVLAADADATVNVDTPVVSTDTAVSTTTTTDTATTPDTTKTTTVKKHHHKKHVKKSEVLNSAPGDTKTSNDDSGMSGDVQAHSKTSVSTEDTTGPNPGGNDDTTNGK